MRGGERSILGAVDDIILMATTSRDQRRKLGCRALLSQCLVLGHVESVARV